MHLNEYLYFIVCLASTATVKGKIILAILRQHPLAIASPLRLSYRGDSVFLQTTQTPTVKPPPEQTLYLNRRAHGLKVIPFGSIFSWRLVLDSTRPQHIAAQQ